VRLQEVEDRLDLIHTLKRKYGDSIQAVLDYAVEAQRELDGITHSEERIAELHQEEEKLLIEIGQLAARLSVARHEASERLSKEIERELADLYMKKARFAVDLTRSEAADGVPVDGQRCAFDATGIDRVEFLISPNPGEPPKPMAKIASGGETSRLMLAMKAVLTAADRIPTLIFDEIDSGIGGRAGGVVGRKLWGLTGEHQVLCVTHLPQLACYGDVHFHVHKEVIGGRTVTRLEELAAMVGSATEATRRSAREMLEQMREWKAKARKGIAKD
jgi:DNA repair protein RecN (Recombination protein N)